MMDPNGLWLQIKLKGGCPKDDTLFPELPPPTMSWQTHQPMNLGCRPGDSSPSYCPQPQPLSLELPLLQELQALAFPPSTPSLCRVLRSMGLRDTREGVRRWFRVVLGQVFVKLLHPHHHTHFINFFWGWGRDTEQRQSPGASSPAAPALSQAMPLAFPSPPPHAPPRPLKKGEERNTH